MIALNDDKDNPIDPALKKILDEFIDLSWPRQALDVFYAVLELACLTQQQRGMLHVGCFEIVEELAAGKNYEAIQEYLALARCAADEALDGLPHWVPPEYESSNAVAIRDIIAAWSRWKLGKTTAVGQEQEFCKLRIMADFPVVPNESEADFSSRLNVAIANAGLINAEACFVPHPTPDSSASEAS